MRLLPLYLLLSHWTPLPWAQIPTGLNFGLDCLNDFFFTITCSLNASGSAPHSNTTMVISNMLESSWLQARDFEGTLFECKLVKALNSWGCSLYMYTRGAFSFTDVDRYQISLFSSLHGNNSSLLLLPKYKTWEHIQPIPPRNLSMQWVGEDAVFSWLSGYEQQSPKYEEHVQLLPFLKYTLRLESPQGHVVDYNTSNRNLSVAMSFFPPGSEYLATVRSQPSQIVYKGVWSQWAPTIRWRTAYQKDRDTSLLTASLISMCLFLMVIMTSYILLIRWRKHAVIPHPALIVTSVKWKDQNERAVWIPSYEEASKIDMVTLQPIPSDIIIIKPSEQLVVARGNRAPVKTDFTGRTGCVQLDSMATETARLPCSEDYCMLSSLTTP